ncbi:hypothetical protein V1634_21405 [Plantactinospora veratri]|uniref:Transmembrane protein n=1 Tax=Plantactinospora veratri TaxID=1436122 RepID=A0ABU7SHI2_9ACTN
MNWSKFIRQSHRWLSMTFTVSMIIVFVALALGEPAEWVYYLPLYPLVLLLFSGLYLFVLPYTARWRGNRRTVRPN